MNTHTHRIRLSLLLAGAFSVALAACSEEEDDGAATEYPNIDIAPVFNDAGELVQPVDFRRGIDGLAAVCKTVLGQDPFEGTVFVFRNRRADRKT